MASGKSAFNCAHELNKHTRRKLDLYTNSTRNAHLDTDSGNILPRVDEQGPTEQAILAERRTDDVLFLAVEHHGNAMFFSREGSSMARMARRMRALQYLFVWARRCRVYWSGWGGVRGERVRHPD